MRVLLVNMPCSSLRPPLGLGLLKSQLAAAGVDARVFNANLRLAQRIGPRFYHFIAEVAPVESLLGEWLFSQCVFPDRPAHGYLEHAQERFGEALPSAAIDRLRAAREQSEDFLNECLNVVLADGADVVGFTSSFAQNLASLALARRLKVRRPELTIAFGGANCEGVMGHALHRAFDFVDLVFSGEADLSLPLALRALESGHSPHEVRGVIARDTDGGSLFTDLVPDRVQDLDTLPYPDYDDFFAQYAEFSRGSRISGLPLESSRGCWWGAKHHCTFCGLNGLAMTYRSKSPARVVAELDALTARHGVRDVQFVDNILDMGYLRTLLPELAGRAIRPALFYETKANLTREHLDVMRKGGVKAIQPGIESLDTTILQLMRKGTTGIRSIELLRNCRELGVWPHWNILYGFPEESPQAYERMAALLPALAHLDAPNVCTRLRLDRFSPLFANSPDAGLTNVRPADAYRLLYDLPQDHLHDLAYYFDYDYADGRDPDAYVAGVREAVRAWQRRRADLLMEDDGRRMTLADTRGDTATVTVLEGPERDLYLRCRTAQTIARLEAEFEAAGQMAPGTVSATLGVWANARLTISLDGHHLALAVDATAVRGSRARRKPSWSAVRDKSLDERPRRALLGRAPDTARPAPA